MSRGTVESGATPVPRTYRYRQIDTSSLCMRKAFSSNRRPRGIAIHRDRHEARGAT